MEERDCVLFRSAIPIFAWETEENRETYRPVEMVSPLTFQTSSSRISNGICTHTSHMPLTTNNFGHEEAGRSWVQDPCKSKAIPVTGLEGL
jgi:hypothetical protein